MRLLLLLLLVIWNTCVCQAGCWTRWVFDLNQCNLNRSCVVRGEEEHRQEHQLWVQKDGFLELLVLVSLVLLLPATGQRWVPKDSDLAQAEPALFCLWVLCVFFDKLEMSGQRGEWKSTDLL